MSRAYTKEEVRAQIIAHVRHLARYWATTPEGGSVEDRCDGVAFSILSMLDGECSLPSFDLVLSPHPENKQFHEAEDENWYEPGMVINDDCHMHELYSAREVGGG